MERVTPRRGSAASGHPQLPEIGLVRRNTTERARPPALPRDKMPRTSVGGRGACVALLSQPLRWQEQMFVLRLALLETMFYTHIRGRRTLPWEAAGRERRLSHALTPPRRRISRSARVRRCIRVGVRDSDQQAAAHLPHPIARPRRIVRAVQERASAGAPVPCAALTRGD